MEDLEKDRDRGQSPSAREEVVSTPLSKGSPASASETTSDEFLDLVIDALRELDTSVQGSFLQKLLTNLAGIDVSEGESLAHWRGILNRRGELAEHLGRPVSLKTAAVDYFSGSTLLRNHVLLEYGELKRLRHSATTDPLTGLYNRRFFDEVLARELNRSSRYSSAFALLLLDLRSLKIANDTYGHSVGDEILRCVARACAENIRGSDIVCRIGGDEFAALLPETERPSAEGLAQRITRKFEDYARALAPKVDLGLDYGLASYPTDGADATKLFDAADRSLYANKQSAYRQKEENEPEPGAPSPELATPQEPSGAPSAQQPVKLSRVSQSESTQARPSDETTRTPGSFTGVRESRRYERMPLQAAPSLAAVRVGTISKLARILDLSFGGVGLLFDDATELPEVFQARFQVPFFPHAEFTLYRANACLVAGNKQRVGCSFAPIIGSASSKENLKN